MTSSMTTWAKLIAVMTLVFAAFFFAPAVDAAVATTSAVVRPAKPPL